MKCFAGNPDILVYEIPAVAKCNRVLQKSVCLFYDPKYASMNARVRSLRENAKKEDMGK